MEHETKPGGLFRITNDEPSDDETVGMDDLLAEAPPQPRRRPGRPRKNPLPEDVTVDVGEAEAKPKRTRRSRKLTTEQVATGIAFGSAIIAESRGTPFWAYSKEEASQWCFPLTDLLNRLPDRWIKHSSMGVGLTFAAMAFWRQTKPRLEAERHFQMQRREHEHGANGARDVDETVPFVWGGTGDD